MFEFCSAVPNLGTWLQPLHGFRPANNSLGRATKVVVATIASPWETQVCRLSISVLVPARKKKNNTLVLCNVHLGFMDVDRRYIRIWMVSLWCQRQLAYRSCGFFLLCCFFPSTCIFLDFETFLTSSDYIDPSALRNSGWCYICPQPSDLLLGWFLLSLSLFWRVTSAKIFGYLC